MRLIAMRPKRAKRKTHIMKLWMKSPDAQTTIKQSVRNTMQTIKALSIVSLLLLLSACSSKVIVKPMPQPIAVESWEMQQQLTDSSYTKKLLQALQE